MAGKLPRGITKDAAREKFKVQVGFQGRTVLIGRYDTLGNAKAALKIARGEIASKTFRPPAQVKRAQRAAIAAAKAERSAQTTTVADWAETWLDHLIAEGRASGTISTYRSALGKWILPEIGTKAISSVGQVKDGLCRPLDRCKAEPCDRCELNRLIGGWPIGARRAVRAMFLAAVDAQVIPSSPLKVSTPHAATPNTLADGQIPSRDDVAALAAAMPRYGLAVLLTYGLALRWPGEPLGLQRGDFDLANKRVHVQRQWRSKPPEYGPCKRDSNGWVEIPDWLVPIVERHLLSLNANPSTPIISSPRNPTLPLSQKTLEKEWKHALTETGLNWRAYDLRHAALTEFGRIPGVSLADLKARGRHRSTEAAMRYYHSDAERQKQIVQQMAPVPFTDADTIPI